MLQKKFLNLYFILCIISGCTCNSETIVSPPINTELLDAIQTINQNKNATRKTFIQNNLDELILQEINKQTLTDSSRYLLKIKLLDKYLYTFPIKKSARLNHHIYRLDNAEEVFIGLEGQFNNYFYESRFNKDLGLAKFYFEESLPDTTLQRFLNMCVLDEYQIIKIK